MDTKRIIVLGIALVAAVGAALMVRSMIGGGTPQVSAAQAPAPVAMTEILVANANLTPGQALAADAVRWDKWPSASVDTNAFITRTGEASLEDTVKGVVVRSPILSNQPITAIAVVKGDASGFMAASLAPGMRAVSIVISPESGAGGFILPNDRIDVIQTRKLPNDRATSRT
ncbi:Flp pilus assembly protein CpaB, partial [bacterium]